MHGEAPDEMLSADKFQFDSLDSIWTLDANRMEIRRWAIIPPKKSVVLKETITLDKNLVRTLDFYRTDSWSRNIDFGTFCKYILPYTTENCYGKESDIYFSEKYKSLEKDMFLSDYRSLHYYMALCLCAIAIVLPAGMSRSAWIAAAVSCGWVYWMTGIGWRRTKMFWYRHRMKMLTATAVVCVVMVCASVALFTMLLLRVDIAAANIPEIRRPTTPCGSWE